MADWTTDSGTDDAWGQPPATDWQGESTPAMVTPFPGAAPATAPAWDAAPAAPAAPAADATPNWNAAPPLASGAGLSAPEPAAQAAPASAPDVAPAAAPEKPAGKGLKDRLPLPPKVLAIILGVGVLGAGGFLYMNQSTAPAPMPMPMPAPAATGNQFSDLSAPTPVAPPLPAAPADVQATAPVVSANPADLAVSAPVAAAEVKPEAVKPEASKPAEAAPVTTDAPDADSQRIQRLETENRQLRQRLARLQHQAVRPARHIAPHAAPKPAKVDLSGYQVLGMSASQARLQTPDGQALWVGVGDALAGQVVTGIDPVSGVVRLTRGRIGG